MSYNGDKCHELWHGSLFKDQGDRENGTEMLQTVRKGLILYIPCAMFYTVKHSVVHDSL